MSKNLIAQKEFESLSIKIMLVATRSIKHFLKDPSYNRLQVQNETINLD